MMPPRKFLIASGSQSLLINPQNKFDYSSTSSETNNFKKNITPELIKYLSSDFRSPDIRPSHISNPNSFQLHDSLDQLLDFDSVKCQQYSTHQGNQNTAESAEQIKNAKILSLWSINETQELVHESNKHRYQKMGSQSFSSEGQELNRAIQKNTKHEDPKKQTTFNQHHQTQDQKDKDIFSYLFQTSGKDQPKEGKLNINLKKVEQVKRSIKFDTSILTKFDDKHNHLHLIQTKQNISLPPSEDADYVEVKPKQNKRKRLSNQYSLVKFTDWVKDIYGENWFEENQIIVSDHKDQTKKQPKWADYDEFFSWD